MNSPPMIDRLKLSPAPIRIGEKTLELLTVEDIEPFLEQIEEKNKSEALESFPYWVKIWEASIVLADHLAQQNIDKSKTVLELGAGMGVTGLFLAAFGHSVTLTDCSDDALALLKKNADRNGLTSAYIKKLDWNDFKSGEKFDIVCGAELVYRQKDIKPAIRAISECVKQNGTVYLAHNIKQISMIEFLAEAGKFFEIEHSGKSITTGDEKKQFVVHTMQPKTGA